ncbi:MAG TPA: LacI family DNA-binding transcriptional regulator [Bacteroidota bacterium]|nr:LacI family DNA-binding transcriptional regulator [Bacteroidota bacterium]
MHITISEIAKLANVSKSAVSIVLNSKPGISEKTRSKILDIIKQYNYRPSHIAKSLAAKETKSIGLIIKEIDNPYFAKVMKGVYDACAQLGYSVLLGSSELSGKKESEIIHALLGMKVDGLLISPLQRGDSDFSYLADLQRRNYPLVVLGEIQNYSTNSVDIDNFAAAYDAVSYLIGLGHTRIAHLTASMHSDHGKKRLEGYKQALHDNNIAINKNFIIPVEPYTASGYTVGNTVFSKLPALPSAVYCYNDLVAIGLIDALLEKNIQVPETVSVIGFDNIEFSAYNKIPLTTIQMPAYEIGEAAATLLIKQLASPSVQLNEKIVLGHKLIVRNSCVRYKKRKQTR